MGSHSHSLQNEWSLLPLTVSYQGAANENMTWLKLMKDKKHNHLGLDRVNRISCAFNITWTKAFLDCGSTEASLAPSLLPPLREPDKGQT